MSRLESPRARRSARPRAPPPRPPARGTRRSRAHPASRRTPRARPRAPRPKRATTNVSTKPDPCAAERASTSSMPQASWNAPTFGLKRKPSPASNPTSSAWPLRGRSTNERAASKPGEEDRHGVPSRIRHVERREVSRVHRHERRVQQRRDRRETVAANRSREQEQHRHRQRVHHREHDAAGQDRLPEVLLQERVHVEHARRVAGVEVGVEPLPVGHALELVEQRALVGQVDPVPAKRGEVRQRHARQRERDPPAPAPHRTIHDPAHARPSYSPRATRRPNHSPNDIDLRPFPPVAIAVSKRTSAHDHIGLLSLSRRRSARNR